MADELTIRMAVTGVTAVEAGIKRVEDAMGRTKTVLTGFNKQVGASIGLINGFSSLASSFGNQTLKDLAASADKAAMAVGNLKNAASLLTSVRTGAWAAAAGTALVTLSAGMDLLKAWQQEESAKQGLAGVNRKLADSILEVTEAQLAQGQISEKQAEDFITQAILAKDVMSGVSPGEMSGRLTGIARILFANQGSAEDEAKAGEIMIKLRRAQIAAGMGVNVRGALAEFDAVQDANAVRAEVEKLKLTAEEKSKIILENEKLLRAQISQIQDANKGGPVGFAENMLANIEAMRVQFQDVGKMIADTLNNTISNAVTGISQQFTQLILGAQTWGQTLRNIGLSIVTDLLQAFIRMGIMWVLQHTIMKAASVALETTRTVAAVAGSKARGVAAIGEAQAIGVATAASAAGSVASIPYVGWALAVAAFTQVLAMVSAANVAAGVLNAVGFAEGGYTGGMGANQVAGVVHGQEFVFSAPAVQAVGLGNLQAMHDSAVSGGGGAGAGTGGGVKIGFVNSAADRREFMRTDPEMRKILIDLITGARQEIGMA